MVKSIGVLRKVVFDPFLRSSLHFFRTSFLTVFLDIYSFVWLLLSFHLQRDEHIWMWVKYLAVHLNELSAITKLIDVLVAQEVWTNQ